MPRLCGIEDEEGARAKRNNENLHTVRAELWKMLEEPFVQQDHHIRQYMEQNHPDLMLAEAEGDRYIVRLSNQQPANDEKGW